MQTTAIVNAILLQDDTVLMVKRAKTRDRYPGCWSFPGGHVEKGESLNDALIREVIEELDVRPLGFRLIANIDDPNIPRVRYEMFVVRLWYGDPKLVGDEHSELRWFSLREVQRLSRIALPAYVPLLRTLMVQKPST